MDIKKVKVEKHSNNKNEYRGDFEGTILTKPKVGQSYTIYGKPLDENADVRILQTSEIKRIIKHKNGFSLITLNSLYKITEL